MPQVTGPGLDLTGFTEVDRVNDPQLLVRYLDQAKLQPTLQALRLRMVEQLRLPRPARVLDAGCGLGGEALELAEAGDVEVAAIDSSRAMIEEARRRADGTGLPVSFAQADAADLPFPDDHFDAVEAQTLLGHVVDPIPVVAELLRVTRPGGRVAALDVDQDSTVLDHPDRATTRLVLQALTDGFANGWAGRHHRRLLVGAGLCDVTVEQAAMELHPAFLLQLLLPVLRRLRTEGRVDAARLDRWWAELEELIDRGLFTGGISWFLTAGTVPDPSGDVATV